MTGPNNSTNGTPGPGNESGNTARPAPWTQRWVRWQDWAGVVLGLYLALSPLWTTTPASATSAAIILGVLLIIASGWSLADPRSMTSEYAQIVLGILLFIAPWPLGYAVFSGAAWTSWVIGVLVILIGLAALPSTTAHATRGK